MANAHSIWLTRSAYFATCRNPASSCSPAWPRWCSLLRSRRVSWLRCTGCSRRWWVGVALCSHAKCLLPALVCPSQSLGGFPTWRLQAASGLFLRLCSAAPNHGPFTELQKPLPTSAEEGSRGSPGVAAAADCGTAAGSAAQLVERGLGSLQGACTVLWRIGCTVMLRACTVRLPMGLNLNANLIRHCCSPPGI